MLLFPQRVILPRFGRYAILATLAAAPARYVWIICVVSKPVARIARVE